VDQGKNIRHLFHHYLNIPPVKGLNAQDGGAPATELVAGTGRGGGGCGRAPNGEGGRLERIRVGEEDKFLLNSIKCRLQIDMVSLNDCDSLFHQKRKKNI
jgi:hypothetical protein